MTKPPVNTRQTPELLARVRKMMEDGKQHKKAIKLAPFIERMKLGFTDRGIRRELAKIGMKANDPRIRETIDEARKECGIADPDADEPVSIIATPYIWQEASEIPMRDWLYGHRLLRKFVTATVGAGGTIKSTLELAEAIAMVSGQALFGIPIITQLRVWYYNLEDPLEEIQRHVMATCMHFGVQKIDLNDCLFINSGRDQPMIIAETTRDGAVICRPIVDAIVEQITKNNIDALIIDPFVSCHRITENDNSAIDLVTKEWGRVADRGNCGVELVHHVRKGDAEVTVESARGGGSFGDAMRMVRVINRMSKEEAEKAGVENSRLYFKAYIDKNNLAPPAESADWFKLVSVDLGNSPTGIGDNIGVVDKWTWPDHLEGITGSDFDAVAVVIRAGKWRENVQAKDWVGLAVAKGLDLDLDVKADKAKVKGLIKAWIKAGSLITVKADDDNRIERVFIEVARESDDHAGDQAGPFQKLQSAQAAQQQITDEIVELTKAAEARTELLRDKGVIKF